MTEEADPSGGAGNLDQVRDEFDRAVASNEESVGRLIDSSREKADAFQTELWRGLLAINGAALVASASILSVDGFPPLFIKSAALLFFLGLVSAAYSWGLGLGFGYWSSQLTLRAQKMVAASAEWVRDRHENLPPPKLRRQLRRGRRFRKRIAGSTRRLKLLRGAHALVPAICLSSAAFFGLGALVLMIGLALFQAPEPSARAIRLILSLN